MRKNLVRRSAVMVATMAASTAGLGLAASAAHADCIKYSETQDYTVTVPGPYGDIVVSGPAPTDINPNDCITLILGG